MGFLENIFGNKEKNEYAELLTEVYNPLTDKIKFAKEREIRELFKTILDASERSLRGILFMSPEEFNFKKEITKEDIDFWIRKVFLVLIAYSYHFYDTIPEAKKDKNLVGLVDLVDKFVWQRIFQRYNEIFNKNIGQKEIDYYTSGLKEDGEKGYTKSGNMEKVFEMANRDYKTIGSELLQKIWKENINSNERKGMFLGLRIWQVHQQIVQPFLVKLSNM